jgi:hypothetical protein
MQRSLGQSATAAVAYRTATRVHDERLDITHDYRARSGVVDTFTIVPDGAPAWATDINALWNAAEAAERVNGRVARELKLALPHQATDAMRREIVERVSWMLVERYGVGVTAAIHAPPERGTGENDHAHILFTTRRIEADGLAKKKERSVHSLDDRKQGPEEITYIRLQCAEITNQVLEAAGSDERVTHLSMAERGLEDEPGVHHGPRLTAINDERKKRGQDPLEPYRRASELRKQWEQLPEEWHGLLVERSDQLVAGPVSSDLKRPDDPAMHHKQRIAGIVEGIAEIDGELAKAKDAEDTRERNRQAELTAVAVRLKLEREQGAKAPVVVRDADPNKAHVKDEAEPHIEQIASGEGLHDIRDDGQSWWQRSANHLRLRARQFRDMAWASWEYTKATWSELTRSVRNRENPRDHDHDHER